MLLNRFEKALMNNPVRSAFQRHLEVPQLLRMGGPAPGALALEVGCGRGVGIELILERFGAERVEAFDLDPKMVALARRRLAHLGDAVCVNEGDVCAIRAEDARYDAVFDFGIVHHVPRWRDGLAEIYRVLKPGGRFYAEEVFERAMAHPVVRRLLDHPAEDRFDLGNLCQALGECGFAVRAKRDLWGLGGFVVASKPEDAIAAGE
jgi:ubiquinone/menaquinone biosynthesis C-methylase UbiE